MLALAGPIWVLYFGARRLLAAQRPAQAPRARPWARPTTRPPSWTSPPRTSARSRPSRPAGRCPSRRSPSGTGQRLRRRDLSTGHRAVCGDDGSGPHRWFSVGPLPFRVCTPFRTEGRPDLDGGTIRIMIVLLSVGPGTLESTMTEDLSPAERYAAARRRAAEQATALASFREMYDFGLDPFQIEACQALEAGKGVLVAAPTGSGKTIVGEFAVHLALQQGKKCFYTTPIKALSNQKYADLCRRYGADKVGLLTGDNSVNSDAPVVVMTTEVLRNMLYAGSQTLLGLGYVVMDEVHYLSDRFRGAVWEEVIIHLPESVTLVSLSATVSNAEEFGDWLDTVRGDTEVIVSEHRPVPLFQHVLAGRRMYDLFEEGEGHRKAVNPDLTRMARMEASRPSYQDRRRGRAMREADRERERRQRSRIWTPEPARGHRAARRRRPVARHHVHLQPRRLRGRRPAVPVRGPAAERRRGAAHGSAPSSRSAPPSIPERGPARPRLLRVAGGPGARHRGPPRGHAADVQGGRRGALRTRPGQGRLRHRDPRARHQHARPLGGVGEARQVERRAARRHHPRRVHPADRPRRPARHRRRGPRRRAVAARHRAPTTWPDSRAPARIRCAPASSRRTTWRSTSSTSSAGTARANCWRRPSRSSRPTSRSSGSPGRCSATRRGWRATRSP